ncbi:hypothetical protein GSI_11768 [Ganoderma sinense ZZ0214-1]|uniref:Uncharacterized protein n=1 Tax=Ganoderma sinense ZZ0214-1 TaxID=1077348 RepID=A0A2G8RX02_9APHY|nr:hypothetical protein GSI_11768 [Ganoderma sinense ZZ0214-1]
MPVQCKHFDPFGNKVHNNGHRAAPTSFPSPIHITITILVAVKRGIWINDFKYTISLTQLFARVPDGVLQGFTMHLQSPEVVFQAALFQSL